MSWCYLRYEEWKASLARSGRNTCRPDDGSFSTYGQFTVGCSSRFGRRRVASASSTNVRVEVTIAVVARRGTSSAPPFDRIGTKDHSTALGSLSAGVNCIYNLARFLGGAFHAFDLQLVHMEQSFARNLKL